MGCDKNRERKEGGIITGVKIMLATKYRQPPAVNPKLSAVHTVMTYLVLARTRPRTLHDLNTHWHTQHFSSRRIHDLKENWFLCFPIKHSTHTVPVTGNRRYTLNSYLQRYTVTNLKKCLNWTSRRCREIKVEWSFFGPGMQRAEEGAFFSGGPEFQGGTRTYIFRICSDRYDCFEGSGMVFGSLFGSV